MKTVQEIKKTIETETRRSAWGRGVNEYALELLEDLKENQQEPTKENLLNGASSWSQYSWGGSSLIYNEDIAKRLCTPSEFKKRHEGDYRPNSTEEWLDTQARALTQAAARIIRIAREG